MKDLGSYNQFIEIKLKQNIDKRKISLSQKIYLEKTLEYTDISEFKPVHCPIVFDVDFQKN